MDDGRDEDLSAVSKALADPTRRQLLDRLRERDGQTLGELCSSLSMARQSASQHLAVLEAANLISTTWHGREKSHHLNPVPLHEVQERWIDEFDRPRLRALSAVRHSAEEQAMPAQPSYVWLRDRRRHRHGAGGGAPERLVVTFPGSAEQHEPPSRVTSTIEPHQEIVRLTVRHDDIPSAEDRTAAAAGWPAVLANLKSLLETGDVLPRAPWEMHAELRAAQLAQHDPARVASPAVHETGRSTNLY